MTTTGSRAMNVAVVLLFLSATGALAKPWSSEDRYSDSESRSTVSSSDDSSPGDDLVYFFGHERPPLGNDVGGEDHYEDEDDDDDDWPSRGPANAGYQLGRPGVRTPPGSDFDSDRIIFPGAAVGPSRFGPTRAPMVSRTTTARRGNTPAPTTPRPGSTNGRPGGNRQPPSPRPQSPRTPTGTGSRRSQDCQRYRQLARAFADNSTLSFMILDGDLAGEGDFPFMAAVGFTGGSGVQFLCGGSLISDRYVLTAAHCITDASSRDQRVSVVRLGQLNLTQGSSTSGDYAVEEVTRHPDHDGRLRYNDVALLRLDRSVQFSAAVTPVCLPEAGAAPPPAGTNVLVAGWGATDALGTNTSPALRRAVLQVVQRPECERVTATGLPRGISDAMTCARDPKGRADTCTGDSGGPLVWRSTNGENTLIGVTSFGGWPCGGSRPGVYAMPAAFISWIEGIVWP